MLCVFAKQTHLTSTLSYWEGDRGKLDCCFENGVFALFLEAGWTFLLLVMWCLFSLLYFHGFSQGLSESEREWELSSWELAYFVVVVCFYCCYLWWQCDDLCWLLRLYVGPISIVKLELLLCFVSLIQWPPNNTTEGCDLIDSMPFLFVSCITILAYLTYCYCLASFSFSFGAFLFLLFLSFSL